MRAALKSGTRQCHSFHSYSTNIVLKILDRAISYKKEIKGDTNVNDKFFKIPICRWHDFILKTLDIPPKLSDLVGNFSE